MKTRRVALSLLLASVAMPALYAHADIGGVGSPVVPSNLPPPANNKTVATDTKAVVKAAAPQPAINTKDNADREPLLVIRFNQQHVYFDRVLRQAVEVTEKTKAGAVYNVVSVEPAGGDNHEQNERISAVATSNLNTVVQEIQNLGVQSSRITTSTQPSATATLQEIDIFVN